MNTPNLPQWLVRIIIIVAIPTIACSGYYSLQHLGEKESVWTTPTLLAYPIALIGIIGLATALSSPQSSRLKIGLWTLCLAIPIAFLLLVRT